MFTSDTKSFKNSKIEKSLGTPLFLLCLLYADYIFRLTNVITHNDSLLLLIQKYNNVPYTPMHKSFQEDVDVELCQMTLQKRQIKPKTEVFTTRKSRTLWSF